PGTGHTGEAASRLPPCDDICEWRVTIVTYWTKYADGTAPVQVALVATSRSRRALSSVSAHSPCGVESPVTPAPGHRWSRPSSVQKVRMATLRSAVRRAASTQPR